MRNRQNTNLGLTLVELLVAISVLGIVAMLGWRGLDSILRTRITLTSEMEQTRGMQLAFAQLQNDCAQLADNYILPNQTPILIAQNQLILIRKVITDNQASQLQVISYVVKNGMLTRRQSATTRDLRELDILWKAAASNVETTPGVILQSDVSELSMRLWIGDGWRTASNVMTSTTAAIPVPSPTLPTGLEVTLQLHGNRGNMFKVFLLGVA